MFFIFFYYVPVLYYLQQNQYNLKVLFSTVFIAKHSYLISLQCKNLFYIYYCLSLSLILITIIANAKFAKTSLEQS